MMTRKRSRDSNDRPRALVTGGAIRLGRAIALALARAGMDVAIGYHSSETAARGTVRALRRQGARGVAVRVNLADAGGPGRLIRRATRALGGLDVLVNNAATFTRTPLGTVSAADFERCLALNLRGPFLCAQAAVRVMPNGGHIVNLGDAGADEAWPGYVPYLASKAGVVALTRGLAAALVSRRIAVNCVAPGAVLRPVGFSRRRWARIRRGRAATVEQVTAAVVFFATCGPSVTGRVRVVAGRRGRRRAVGGGRRLRAGGSARRPS